LPYIACGWQGSGQVLSIEMQKIIQILNVMPRFVRIWMFNQMASQAGDYIFRKFFKKFMMVPLIKNEKICKNKIFSRKLK